MLALALGRDLSEIGRMPLAEFTAWRAFYGIQPFGHARGDIQAGIVASTIANVHRVKGSKTYSPADFMPQFGKPASTPDEMIQQRIERFMNRYH